MNSMPDLQPIVIPALEHKLYGNLFTCLGDGLRKDGHTFDDHVERYLPLLEPVLTKAGKVRVHQPQIRKQPLSYWKAQCVFRKMPQTGTVASLQERLRFSDAGLDSGLEELEKTLNREFRVKNAAARNAKWDLLATLEAKAEADPKRFILEHFSQKPETIVVLKRIIDQSYINNPRFTTSSTSLKPGVDRWIVIGKDKSAVYEKIRGINREATRVRQQAEQLRAERTRKLHERVVSTINPKDNAWDVIGSWLISCPYVEEQWGAGDSGCSLKIYVTGSGSRRQMSAEFDFIAITGIFRFISPVTSDRCTGQQQSLQSVATASAKIGHARPKNNGAGENDDEEEDVEDDEENYDEDGYDEFRESPPLEEFYLSTPDLPSSQHPKWNYRWRGEETGEGEIQLYSDETLCSVTLFEPGGTKLMGIFDSGLTGRIDFAGLKTGATTGGGDADYEWNCRSERVYESARVGRWH
ncbi:hypothetical protein MMC11_000976 [Xylographa trunciseda]|nr:hypothetical protein [Xylographa trunciseda]